MLGFLNLFTTMSTTVLCDSLYRIRGYGEGMGQT